jgi:hypothetical protein
MTDPPHQPLPLQGGSMNGRKYRPMTLRALNQDVAEPPALLTTLPFIGPFRHDQGKIQVPHPIEASSTEVHYMYQGV